MSKELEILEDLSKEEIVVRDRSSVYMNPNDNGKGAFTHLTTVGVNFKGAIETIKQYILRAQEQEKVLEILFKKQVDLGWLWYCIHECVNSLNEYNKKMPIEKFKLTEEEFELLKRWFR